MSSSKDDSTNPIDEAEKAASEVDEIIENTEQGEGDIFDDLFNDDDNLTNSLDYLIENLTEGEATAEDNSTVQNEDENLDFLVEETQEDLKIELDDEVTWTPPPIPTAPKSFSAKLWDASPEWVRSRLTNWGLEAPLDAMHSSSIFAGMGSKGAMLLGPPSAGKTTLIAAINRACLIPVESDIDLRWRASGDEQTQYELTDLLDKAIRQILQEDDGKDINTTDGIAATNRHVRYDFTIEGRAKIEHHFNGAQIFNMKLSFHDAPGGAMFTTKRSVWDDQETTRREMLSEAKGAYTLIFCFDGSTRQARLMQSSLARILPLLQSTRRGRYMYPMRVVVLLNKMDQVCDDFYTKLAKEFPSIIQNPSITPETIAADLDPLAMAIECLGYESLKSLRDAMRPDAELAVGLISTWGFNYEGKPLVGPNGRPNFLTIANRGHGNDFVSQWKPYGIRETLIYLATGRTSPNLHVMRPEDFNQTMYAPRSIHLQNQTQHNPQPTTRPVNDAPTRPPARQNPYSQQRGKPQL